MRRAREVALERPTAGGREVGIRGGLEGSEHVERQEARDGP